MAGLVADCLEAVELQLIAPFATFGRSPGAPTKHGLERENLSAASALTEAGRNMAVASELSIADALWHSTSTHHLIGGHPTIIKLRALIERVAATDSTVLITGESGSGKEIVAREIYALSRRSLRNFVPVNCAAIPNDLMESEMFGHQRGRSGHDFSR
jgi:transcriptional regulator with GAF, ATPase, and Fis domain